MTAKVDAVRALFSQTFDAPADGVWHAPGRVNLLGEHTDYAGGMVLPIALAQGTNVAARRRADDQIHLVTETAADQPVRLLINDVAPGGDLGWAAYAAGVLWAAAQQGLPVSGVELAFVSDLPVGAGLSSSAALSCVTALALSDLLSWSLDPHQLAALARSAENHIAGAPTGVMDQLASVCGVADHALAIDTLTEQIDVVPFRPEIQGACLLVIDSHTPHALVAGEYADRRRAVAEAERLLGVEHLARVGLEEVDASRSVLGMSLWRKARHVVSDSARVQDAVRALKSGNDIRRIGTLFNESHASMRDAFEITVDTVDLIQQTAVAAGAHGARMTGGGFGGCVIALVDSSEVDRVQAACASTAARAGHPTPTAFVAGAADGARRLE